MPALVQQATSGVRQNWCLNAALVNCSRLVYYSYETFCRLIAGLAGKLTRSGVEVTAGTSARNMAADKQMKIVILAIGTLGDVQPYLALGVGLQEAGYELTLATHQCFAELVASHRLRFAPLAGDPVKWAEGGELLALASSGRNFRKWMLALRTLAQPLMPQVLHSCWQACQETGAIIYSPFAWAGYSIAERLGVPSFIACLQPMTVTARFPSAWSPLQRSLGGPCNRLSHIMTQQLYWHVNQPFINRWRVMDLGLPPLPNTGPFKESRWQTQPYLYG